MPDARPDALAWRTFIDRLLLWTGTTSLAAALVFFLAYNWQDLGRYARFGLAEAAIVAALVVVWRFGTEHPAGKAALLAASIFAGALLALIGQTYQTGADTFELFAAWAVAILPWTVVARFAGLWLLWLAVANLSISLYFQAFDGVFGILFGVERQLWMLFAFDTGALAALELARFAGVAWLQPRWSLQVVATASGALITSLTMMAAFDGDMDPAYAGWLLWLGGTYLVYRRRLPDLYLLAGAALSVILVTASLLIKHVLSEAAVSFLLVAVVVIAISAAAGWWLRQVAREAA
jgi:uncharacterized membrane protein